MARLTMLRGPNPGEIFELAADEITLGSGSKNDIIIMDHDVNREHCCFIRGSTGYELQNFESASGTFVNGQPVSGTWPLPARAIIEIGDSVSLEYEPDDPSKTAADIVRVTRTSTAPIGAAVEAEQPYLVIVTSSEPRRVYRLEQDVIDIGRALSNDIVVQEAAISRHHTRLRRFADGYVIEDLGSANGTWLNGTRLTAPRMLRPDDIVKMGKHVRIQYAEDSAETVMGYPPASGKQGRNSASGKLAKLKTDQVDFLPTRDKSRGTSPLGTGIEPGTLGKHVMVAYAREDWNAVVAPLVLRVQDAGLDVWVDQYLAYGGGDWVAAIEQAIQECWLMIVVASPAALATRHVRQEYLYFYNREKPIITLLYKIEERLPMQLMRQRAVDYDPADPEQAYHKIIAEIKAIRASML